ncbi:MAG: hypothetical protein HY200_10125 [Nitrospirae bacterium]|nr:hypothetical protein [Nitrospirota bacterium]MBI3595302.1 hypothetical protein [Nitrospirota bacterium]
METVIAFCLKCQFAFFTRNVKQIIGKQHGVIKGLCDKCMSEEILNTDEIDFERIIRENEKQGVIERPENRAELLEWVAKWLEVS